MTSLKTEKSKYEYLPKSFDLAKEKYNELHHLLNNLSQKLSDVSSNVDKEFLSSYRVHMLTIQSEVKELKQEVVERERVLNSDKTVSKLESEVKWFFDERNKLKIQFDSVQNDCEQMKVRLSSMKEQKKYLSQQLKSVMKRNKVLEADIAALIDKNDSISSVGGGKRRQEMNFSMSEASLRDDSMTLENGIEEVNELDNYSGAFSLPNNKKEQFLVLKTQSSSPYIGGLSRIGSVKSNPALMDGFVYSPPTSPYRSKRSGHSQFSDSSGSEEDEDQMKFEDVFRRPNKISTSTKQIEKIHKKTVKKLNPDPIASPKNIRRNLKKKIRSRSALEVEMEKIINETFQEIRIRKTNSFRQSSKKRLPLIQTDSVSSLKNLLLNNSVNNEKNSSEENKLELLEDDKAMEEQQDDDKSEFNDPHLPKFSMIDKAGGISGLGLSHFSDTDKFSVIIKLLMNFNCLQQVTNKMRTEYLHGFEDMLSSDANEVKQQEEETDENVQYGSRVVS